MCWFSIWRLGSPRWWQRAFYLCHPAAGEQERKESKRNRTHGCGVHLSHRATLATTLDTTNHTGAHAHTQRFLPTVLISTPSSPPPDAVAELPPAPEFLVSPSHELTGAVCVFQIRVLQMSINHPQGTLKSNTIEQVRTCPCCRVLDKMEKTQNVDTVTIFILCGESETSGEEMILTPVPSRIWRPMHGPSVIWWYQSKNLLQFNANTVCSLRQGRSPPFLLACLWRWLGGQVTHMAAH